MSETKDPRGRMTVGVITFLDVLGWKGIYYRESDPIAKLQDLVADLGKELRRAVRGLTNPDAQVKSISDTIVLVTRAGLEQAAAAIEAHGQVCALAISQSVVDRIPVRGATTFGEFLVRENIYVGKAIDDAAAWYEQGDWIGVHLTPSAYLAVEDLGALKEWVEYLPPTGRPLAVSTGCVNWPKRWAELVGQSEPLPSLRRTFREMGPLIPEIANKYLNTLKFVKFVGAKAATPVPTAGTQSASPAPASTPPASAPPASAPPPAAPPAC